jgi:cell division protein FtsL
MTRRVKPTRSPSKLVPAVLALAIVAAGFTMLMVRLDVTREGYRLSELRQEVAGLENRNRSLRLEAAELSSHQRLRALAAKYHLGPPAPGQVVTLP